MPQTIGPFVAGLSRGLEEKGEGGLWIAPLTLAQPDWPRGHGGQQEFCAGLPGEQPLRTCCKYCQNTLHKLFSQFFSLRFTQFVGNKIESHSNGKERVT